MDFLQNGDQFLFIDFFVEQRLHLFVNPLNLLITTSLLKGLAI
jgi:hypothetical protein